MNNTTYKRGQVEWALWRFFCVKPDARTKPPIVFNTRIKRLLELDRAGIKNAPGFAFSDSATSGRGSDATFSAFDAFCLAVAMDLLDAGFKQSEIIFFLTHVRPSLSKEYKYISRFPFPPRQQTAAEDYPNLPSYKFGDRKNADTRVFMVTRKIELKEIFSNDQKQEMKKPLLLRPDFFRGIEKLTKAMNKNSNYYRKATLVELYETAYEIDRLLKKAPEFRRGRP